jgi:hypothetical protein
VGLIWRTSGVISLSSWVISVESCWWRRASERSACAVAVCGGGVRIVGAGGVGSAGGQVADQLGIRERAQLGAQRFGGGDDQRLDLTLRVGALVDRAAAGDPQRGQGLHRATAPLGQPVGAPGLGGPGGGLGIQRVGLAVPAPGRPVGAVDLDHGHPGLVEVCGQFGAVAAGAFDTDQHQLSERAQPGQQRGIPGRGGRELAVPQQPALPVHGRGGVGVAVGVHPAGHLHHRADRVARPVGPVGLVGLRGPVVGPAGAGAAGRGPP